jgi:hypothetical protein
MADLPHEATAAEVVKPQVVATIPEEYLTVDL